MAKPQNKIIFNRYGKTYHLEMNTAEEIKQVFDIDLINWVATSAPVSAFDLDADYLNYIDARQNKRILTEEVLDHLQWVFNIFTRYDSINEKSSALSEFYFNRSHKDGQKILAAIQKVRSKLGLDATQMLTLQSIKTLKELILQYAVSEGGVVTADQASEDIVKDYITRLVLMTGGTDHPSGEKGINAEIIIAFSATLECYLGWKKKNTQALLVKDNAFLPFGRNTGEKYKIFIQLEDKIDQYYAQSKALFFSKKVSDSVCFLNDVDVTNFNWQDSQAIDAYLKTAPLAEQNENLLLDISSKLSINPIYLAAITDFFEEIANMFLEEFNGETLSEAQWLKIKECFSVYDAWVKSNPEPKLDLYDREDITLLKSEVVRDEVIKLINQSNETAFDLESVRLIEKVILTQKYLLVFLNNFVSFPYLYSANTRSLFEKGDVVIDGRRFRFSIEVKDKAKHMEIAKSSNIFILYLEVSPPSSDKFTVAVPVTSGAKGNLIEGKRAIFINTKGDQFDAIVTGIIENPISLREALSYPFKRVGSLFSSKLDTLNKDGDKQLTRSTTNALDRKASVEKPKGNGLSAGAMLMGGGVAFAAVGSTVTYIASTFASISISSLVCGFLVVLLIILAPAFIITWIKLRKRDLSPILEGSEWAINAKMGLTHRLGKLFSPKPHLPKGTKFKRVKHIK